MKGLQGILIAVALGIIGALCNWFYIQRQAANFKMVSFIIIKPGAQVNAGDRFKEEHLDHLDIPQDSVGNIIDVAVPYADKAYVIGKEAIRTYQDNELILQRDLRTPGVKDFADLLAEGEVARSIPVDARTFVPERVNPGNLVSFVVPNLMMTPGENKPKATTPGVETEVFGPFRVLALGTRTGREEVLRATGKSIGPQHVLTIGVKFPLEPEVARMFELLRLSGNQNVQVMIHSSKTELIPPAQATKQGAKP